MDDVSSHLGISKKTLYEHFRDKEDLVQMVLMDEHEKHCSFLNDIEGRELNAVEEMFEVYKMINAMYKEYNPSMVYDVRKYYPGLFARVKEIRRGRMYETALNNLNKGKREGLYRLELDSVAIAKLHVFRIESMSDNDMFTQEELISFPIFHEFFVYHVQGILSHEGRCFFELNFNKFKATL
jgi:AcrR family transcriptional regulator